MNLKQITFLFLLSIIIFACETEPLPSNTDYVRKCAEGEISFNQQILPTIISNCSFSGCHSAGSAKDGIVLENYKQILSLVKKGKPTKSKLYKVITDDDDDLMPPSPYSKLSAQTINMIKQWISDGANKNDCLPPCDPSNFKFSADIFPIIKDNCVGCHNSENKLGNVNLENYNEILPYAEVKLIGVVSHSAGFSPMPPNNDFKLSDCQIDQITNWINDGKKNN